MNEYGYDSDDSYEEIRAQVRAHKHATFASGQPHSDYLQVPSFYAGGVRQPAGLLPNAEPLMRANMLRTASEFLKTLKAPWAGDLVGEESCSPHRANQPPHVTLINRMSLLVRTTNDSMNSVLHSLLATEKQRFETSGAAERADLVNIDKIDPRVLLHQNSKSIRNLNHSVMKLMAVQ